jgi:hypothetical protein
MTLSLLLAPIREKPVDLVVITPHPTLKKIVAVDPYNKLGENNSYTVDGFSLEHAAELAARASLTLMVDPKLPEVISHILEHFRDATPAEIEKALAHSNMSGLSFSERNINYRFRVFVKK